MELTGPRRLTAVSGGSTPVLREIAVGSALLVGREGDLALGVAVEDRGVSRRAALITALPDGWDVRVTNRHGAVLHPWGQAAVLARPREVVCWPRVGLRVRGEDDAVEHWVLLEADDVPLVPEGALRRGHGPTTVGPTRATNPLTPAQLAAVEVVFADHLRWPPVSAPQAMPLKAAARRLGISEAGVKDRLHHARRRIQQLGLRGPDSSTDPHHVHALVRAGLLPVPPPCRAAVWARRPNPDLIVGVRPPDTSGATR